MKKIAQATLLAIVAISLLHFTSCKEEEVRGKGEIKTEQRTVSAFDKIIIELPVEATIIMGDAEAVEIKTYGNMQEHILTEVINNTLRIYHKESLIRLSMDKAEAIIHVPALSQLDINGAADAKIKGDISGNSFELHVRGASDVDIEHMHVAKLNVILSGASELTIADGNADNAEYKVTGAGDVNAGQLVTKTAAARVSGTGDINLHVTDKLDAHISGAGDIGYTGHPVVTSQITGIGSISDRN